MADSNVSEAASDGSAASLGSHTPGPWKVSRRFDIYEDLGPTVGGTYVGTTRGNHELPESINLRCEADARLIAASPKMYAAIQAALRIENLWMPPDDQNDPNHDGEFAALALMRQQFRDAIRDV